jgi:hypothetical protein
MVELDPGLRTHWAAQFPQGRGLDSFQLFQANSRLASVRGIADLSAAQISPAKIHNSLCLSQRAIRYGSQQKLLLPVRRDGIVRCKQN